MVTVEQPLQGLRLIDASSMPIEARMIAAREQAIATGRKHKEILRQIVEPFIVVRDISMQLARVEDKDGSPSIDEVPYLVLSTFQIHDRGEVSRLLLYDGSLVDASLREGGMHDLASATEISPKEYPRVASEVVSNVLSGMVKTQTEGDFVALRKRWADEESGRVERGLKELLSESMSELVARGLVPESSVRVKDMDGLESIDTRNFLIITPFYFDDQSAASGLLLCEDGSLLWADMDIEKGIYDFALAIELTPQEYPNEADEAFQTLSQLERFGAVSEAVKNNEYREFLKELLESDSQLVRASMQLLEREKCLFRVEDGDNEDEDFRPRNLQSSLAEQDQVTPYTINSENKYAIALINAQFSHVIERSWGDITIQVLKSAQSYTGGKYELFLTVQEYLKDGELQTQGIRFTEKGQIISSHGRLGKVTEVFEEDVWGDMVVNTEKEQEAMSQARIVVHSVEKFYQIA